MDNNAQPIAWPPDMFRPLNPPLRKFPQMHHLYGPMVASGVTTLSNFKKKLLADEFPKNTLF